MKKSKQAFQITTYCEYTKAPICVQTQNPRLSWEIDGSDLPSAQTSYRILVSSTREKINQGIGDLWDSGKVESNRSTCIVYEGNILKSKSKYFWRVSIFTIDNMEITSEIDTFETAIFDNTEWRGKWIEHPEQTHGISPLFRKTIQLKHNPVHAKIYICGLGFYTLHINGKRVGDRYLEPGWTNYNKRILYSVYDVSEYVTAGDNVIAVELGEGWYGHQHSSFLKYMGKHPVWNATPKLMYEMDIMCEDGSSVEVQTGDGCDLCIFGPIRENGIYNGEFYDASFEVENWDQVQCDLAEWMDAKAVSVLPCGNLQAQIMPAIKITQVLNPVGFSFLKKNIQVYDFGQNFSGWVEIVCQGKAGSKVVLRYGETVQNGHVNQQNLRDALSCNTYILKGTNPLSGKSEKYEPRYTYHGFRYVEIESSMDVEIISVIGKVVHTAVDIVGQFSCSNETINWIQEATLWTERSNMHSVPTDCPQRDERMAWLNDVTVRCTEAFYNFDSILFYENWLMDIADEQVEETGSIPDTAPHVYCGNPALHVSSCFVLIPWLIYLHYGDLTVIKRFYPKMKKYVQFLYSQTTDQGLIGSGYYGEWAPPANECLDDGAWNATPKNIPPGLISTGYIYYDCRLMKEMAGLIGHQEDIQSYDDMASAVKEAINKQYLQDNGIYATGVQGCQVFPLFLGITPDEYTDKVWTRLLKNLIDANDYHITTGNQTTKYLFDVLSMFDRNDVALKIATVKGYPGFEYMRENGATTIWERWEHMTGGGMNSHNHPMNAAFSSWFYKSLGGILLEAGIGESEIHIRPDISVDLTYVKASYRSKKGVIQSYWKRESDKFELRINVPWNLSVRLQLKEYQTQEGKIVFSDQYNEMVLPSGIHRLMYDGKSIQLEGSK